MSKFASVVLFSLLGVVLTGCPALNSDNKFVIQKAQIESVEIQILESFPVQVHLVVRGFAGDGCTEIYQVTKRRETNTFLIEILTRRPADAICIQILKSFEETIALDVFGLKAGTYTVNVNGVIDRFTLDEDNSPPTIE